MNIKKFLTGSIASILFFGLFAIPAFASTVVYDALPSVTPQTSYPSQPFQAQQTFEFGDSVHLGGTDRLLNSVTVTFVTWARFSEYTSDDRYSGNNTSWTHPITLNVYSTHLGANGAPDQLLGTVTQNVNIPWRPEGDASCSDEGYGAGFAWKDVNGVCRNGLAFNADFDLTSLHVNLPDDVIISVAYNTQSYGISPIGSNGPYNSLNVAVPPSQSVSVGSDNDVNSVFWNTSTCSYYTDGGSAGCNILRQDTNWTPYGTVALRVNASSVVTPTPTPTPTPVLVGPPTNLKQCLRGGWKTFNNPIFRNQFQCAWYVLTHKIHKGKVDVDIKMSNPRQKMEADLKEGTGSNLGNVEYQNLDYPGGLKYKAKALCVYVNKSTKESRFMFQIPAGHPGLSGLYVVSYVKDGGVPGKTHDLYGHSATSDLTTAQNWCSDGTGFAPSMYSVTTGNVLVH